MTVDHLPQSIADLAKPAKHTDDNDSASKAQATATRAKELPEPKPAPAVTSDADENWQQSGFGSFP